MATATCKTVAGVLSVAQMLATVSSTCFTSSGAETAAGNVRWGGSGARRKAISWLPSAQVPILMDDGKTMHPLWYKAFHEAFEVRLGGVDAPTVPQIVTGQVAVQAQVAQTQNDTAQVSQGLNQIAGAVNTSTQTLVNAGVAGANQVPTLPHYDIGDRNSSN